MHFRKDVDISVRGKEYALLEDFQSTYAFLLRAIESVLVLVSRGFHVLHFVAVRPYKTEEFV